MAKYNETTINETMSGKFKGSELMRISFSFKAAR
jgi:hypothetical protein